ncbi:MAG TPA: beta-ketoacyl synthase N-terminal-like domain-containing protein [Smithella sp.]|nr:beta-ketoacyl synthase N-terminal-like domain-containing protein [Smithella sp.]HPL47485.1 beta-ketoacyl synthase N-terminal-like domain-containing protein [Smithella sp.]HPX31067.1 beta-ketoacyl synthase N-terminal-like domain-containing protein [Smithella sp.]HQL98131.1 beta-ketoacyl synthase N-terminal-like domain-containing protein [Smithella sp.]
MERRVVITGMSAITPIGHGKDQIVQSLLNGTSGIKPLREEEFLSSFIHSKVYGTVDYPVEYDFKRNHRKTMGPVAYYACQVAREVLEQSGLTEDFITSGRLGVAFGSIHGSPTIQRNIYKIFFGAQDKIAVKEIGAVDYLKSMVHTTAVNITKMFGITGRVISSGTACTTSSQSIGYGYESVKFGMQDAMLCGGADEYDTTTVAVFDNLLACSTAFNNIPSKTPRPFDKDRDGLVVGEGAGAVMLEEYEHARKRGATILGEVIGFACNNNGGDMILPNLTGITNTLKLGVETAKINPEEVDLISAHATATKMGDIIEAQAINAVFGCNPHVIGLKSYTGHTMAACGAIETIMALYMMQEGFIAPTLNLENIDERCAMLKHVQKLTDHPVKTAAIQNFAFGGVNTMLMIKKFS